MSPALTSRRRAEAFDRLIGGHAPHHASVEGTRHPELTELVELVGQLRAVDPVEPRAEFSQDLRSRLMLEAETALVASPRTAPTTDTRRRDRRIAAVVGGIALVGASGSVAMASQSALPGDGLYPIKRVVEDARGSLAGDDGASLVRRATARLDEATALAMRGEAEDGDRIATTLEDYTEQAGEAGDALLADYAETGDPESITALHDFTSSSMTTLEALAPLLPEAAQDELDAAAQRLEELGTQAQDACAECLPETGPVVFTAGPALDLPSIVSTQPEQDDSSGTTTPDDGAQQQQPQQGEIELPDVSPQDLPPGSVNPGQPTGPTTTVLDPVQDLTGGLTQPRDPDAPVTSTVTQPVRDLGGLLNQTLDPVTGLGGAVQDTTDGLGDTVDDTADGLDDTLDGLTGR